MIHTDIGYGYVFDDETKTLIGLDIISSYGFFSTFTLMLVSIINVYKDLNDIVLDIDGSNLLKNLSSDKNLDMYKHFFHIDENYSIDLDKSQIHKNLIIDEQHTIYKNENIKTFNQFMKKYFNLNKRIIDLCEFFKEKYNIDSDNSISVIYRDTDKWTDLGGFNYISPAFYYRITKNLKTLNPNLNVLVQSENNGVKRVFRESFSAKYIEETLESENSGLPLFLTMKRNKLEWADAYVASLWIHSKSKYVITYTGNSGFFIYLFRGNTNNLYQEITFTKNNENEFFIKNA